MFLLVFVQLTVLVDKYEAGSCSIVDASTKKAFESPAVRKALVGYAKAIQRIANLSILPEREMKVLTRLHAGSVELIV